MPSFALIGPPGSGKSTVFELVAGIAASRTALKQNFSADRAMVPVPDRRFEKLSSLFNPKKRTPVSLEILDIPGVDAQTDAKLRTVAMTEVKKADGIAVVLNLFLPGAHESALAALREVWDELVFADYAVTEKGIENVEGAARSKHNVDAERRHTFLLSLIPHLEGGTGLRNVAVRRGDGEARPPVRPTDPQADPRDREPGRGIPRAGREGAGRGGTPRILRRAQVAPLPPVREGGAGDQPARSGGSEGTPGRLRPRRAGTAPFRAGRLRGARS